MIYTRKFQENRAVLDYNGTNKDLRLEMLLTINTMLKNKDLEEDDLCILVLGMFKDLNDVNKLTLVDLLINNLKGGNLWQELEDLNKSEKK